MTTNVPETPADFETAMDALEALVTRMESGSLPLEQTLQEFQSGMELVQACQKSLDEAQRRVEQLVEPERNAQHAAPVDSLSATKVPDIALSESPGSARPGTDRA